MLIWSRRISSSTAQADKSLNKQATGHNFIDTHTNSTNNFLRAKPRLQVVFEVHPPTHTDSTTCGAPGRYLGESRNFSTNSTEPAFWLRKHKLIKSKHN
ncbi:hypothetical protein LSTR_LSTR015796 [Laodelphax striatellus]|uniref:Uncharacterized protein n=1 Tax=Laodelphax striatellus TaxID=195883 RepID=A0A482WG38_LAOST|nr:hypothetical protein LSTR_LSTR015796 [Laodelphax striatellus]